MLDVLCENEIYVGGEKRKCGRWLASLTDLQIDIMKVDPEAVFYLRCPACKSNCRWVTIKHSDGGLIFSSGAIKPSKAQSILQYHDAVATEECA